MHTDNLEFVQNNPTKAQNLVPQMYPLKEVYSWLFSRTKKLVPRKLVYIRFWMNLSTVWVWSFEPSVWAIRKFSASKITCSTLYTSINAVHSPETKPSNFLESLVMYWYSSTGLFLTAGFGGSRKPLNLLWGARMSTMGCREATPGLISSSWRRHRTQWYPWRGVCENNDYDYYYGTLYRITRMFCEHHT